MDERAATVRRLYGLVFDRRTRRTTDKDIPKVRAIAAGLSPALNDARIRFTWPSGIRTASLAAGRTDPFVTLPVCPRRAISSSTASRNLRSSASSRYSSDRGRSLGSLIRRLSPEVGNARAPPCTFLALKFLTKLRCSNRAHSSATGCVSHVAQPNLQLSRSLYKFALRRDHGKTRQRRTQPGAFGRRGNEATAFWLKKPRLVPLGLHGPDHNQPRSHR